LCFSLFPTRRSSDLGTSSLGAGALSMVLSESFTLRLVVLNACDTGRSSSLDSFSSVAGALVRRGIAGILAMQFEITDRELHGEEDRKSTRLNSSHVS